MSILNNMQNMARMGAENFGNNITGAHNAIKQFVEAKRGEANQEDNAPKGKQSIMKGAIAKSK